MEHALALEHVDHLVVDVAVLGGAAWGDDPVELGELGAADLVGDQVAELPVAAGRQQGLVVVADDAPAVELRRRILGRDGRDEQQRLRARVFDLVGLAGHDVRPGARLDLVLLAADDQLAAACSRVHDLLDAVERARLRAAGLVAGEVQLEHLRAQGGVDRDGPLGGVALGARRLEIPLGYRMPRHASILPRKLGDS